MVSKVYICFYPLHNSPQIPLTAKFQGKAKCSSKSKHNNDTYDNINRQSRDTKGYWNQHIQEESTN